MLVYVLSADGSPLMPTTNIRKVRHMLKDGRAVIAGHKPGLTIRLTYALPEQEAPRIQDTELCMDTGDHHIGLSVKSEKHEFVHAQYDLLPDEKKRHDACRKYRRTRRGRKRYRKARFDNRRKPEGWLAPSIKNKVERHAGLVKTYRAVLPVTDVVLETARFDTQLLEAEQRAKAGETVSVPKGKDYQHGPKFKLVNLREAVFTRDGYHCRICGKGPEDGAILHVHHALYWKGDHTDRMSGLLTVCDKCHTPANHKKGGKLFELKPSVRSMAGAAFMNTIRWRILALVRTENPDIRVSPTNGAATKDSRKCRCIEKTHANDACCMGRFRPRHKARPVCFQKRRRNNRVLAKFYDAKYIDTRDGSTQPGQALANGRTNRRDAKHGKNDFHPFRGRKVSKGRTSVRTTRYPVQSGDTVRYQGKTYLSKGCQHYGQYVTLLGHKAVPVKQTQILRHASGWVPA